MDAGPQHDTRAHMMQKQRNMYNLCGHTALESAAGALLTCWRSVHFVCVHIHDVDELVFWSLEHNNELKNAMEFE